MTGGDLAIIKPHLGECLKGPPTCQAELSHPKWDYNRDGVVTGPDYALIKPLLGHQAPACQP